MESDPGKNTPALEPILRTKLHRPQLDADLLNRDSLRDSSSEPLILRSGRDFSGVDHRPRHVPDGRDGVP